MAIVKKLAHKSDVLIEPFRKGVMEKLGLDPTILMKDNPKLIYARLTGYGQSGSFSSMAGHDINYAALSGLLSLFGRAHEKPIFPANLIADFGGGGLMCALGVILALYERQSSGLGQVIDSSMVEGSAYLGSWLFRSQKLPIWGQKRGHNVLDTGAHFYEIYETKDGKFMTVGALEPQFYAALLKGLALTEEQVPQYGDFNTMKSIFIKKFKEKSQKEWCELFDGTDACVAPLLSLEEAVEHPHNLHRQSFIKTDEDIIPKPSPLLSRTPGQTKGVEPLPETGQHTKIILESLGYSDFEINALISDNVVACANKSKL